MYYVLVQFDFFGIVLTLKVFRLINVLERPILPLESRKCDI